MRKLLGFGRCVGLLAVVVLSAAVGASPQVGGSPILLVDNSEKQELCNDPSLIAYPCFRTIPEAIGRASGSFLVWPSGQPYAGFEVCRDDLLVPGGSTYRGQTRRV